MAETKNYTEEEAYGMLQTALLTGQDALDSLPDDVKTLALGAAERSLAPGRGGFDLSKEELESPDREGFTPVVEPPSDEVDRKGYDLTKEELDSPDREGSTPVPGMTPQGLTDEAEALTTKDTLEDGELERLQELQKRLQDMIEAEQRMRAKKK
tara:strand:- start:5570 stop:6031 length:462 start_codon:yes stop_codon:yes gene_type:complete